MATVVGHVAPGLGFIIIGLWHLFNHIRLHARGPSSYLSLIWFPAPGIRYLELYLIMFGCSTFAATELFVGGARHRLLEPDGTIQSRRLHNLEHSLISLSFLAYAVFAIIFDRAAAADLTKAHTGASFGLTQLVAAVAFSQQLLLFHLHSADHAGVEGQYHMLLQLVILVSLSTTLIGIGVPRSFLVSFVRSASILFQGIWLVIIGYMLWTPKLIPKGCFMNLEDGHYVVRCHSDEALHRAKSLVNIEFSSYTIGVTVFSVSLYLVLTKIYGDKIEYQPLHTETMDEDIESQEMIKINLDDDEQPKTSNNAGKLSSYPTGIVGTDKLTYKGKIGSVM